MPCRTLYLTVFDEIMYSVPDARCDTKQDSIKQTTWKRKAFADATLSVLKSRLNVVCFRGNCEYTHRRYSFLFALLMVAF